MEVCYYFHSKLNEGTRPDMNLLDWIDYIQLKRIYFIILVE